MGLHNQVARSSQSPLWFYGLKGDQSSKGIYTCPGIRNKCNCKTRKPESEVKACGYSEKKKENRRCEGSCECNDYSFEALNTTCQYIGNKRCKCDLPSTCKTSDNQSIADIYDCSENNNSYDYYSSRTYKLRKTEGKIEPCTYSSNEDSCNRDFLHNYNSMKSQAIVKICKRTENKNRWSYKTQELYKNMNPYNYINFKDNCKWDDIYTCSNYKENCEYEVTWKCAKCNDSCECSCDPKDIVEISKCGSSKCFCCREECKCPISSKNLCY